MQAHKLSFPLHRPNTHPLFPVYTPMPPQEHPASTLLPHQWAELLSTYPNPALAQNIVGIATHGARIGYKGPPLQIMSETTPWYCKYRTSCHKTSQMTQLGRV